MKENDIVYVMTDSCYGFEFLDEVEIHDIDDEMIYIVKYDNEDNWDASGYINPKYLKTKNELKAILYIE